MPCGRVITGALYATVSSLFVMWYSRVRLSQYNFQTTRKEMIAICEFLLDHGVWALLVPLTGIALSLWFWKRHNGTGLVIVSEGLRLFAVCWFLLCLLVWEAQQVPRVNLEGFM